MFYTTPLYFVLIHVGVDSRQLHKVLSSFILHKIIILIISFLVLRLFLQLSFREVYYTNISL